jgi:predicted rRNA methylase YqxC with S4 and FtsJ domains
MRDAFEHEREVAAAVIEVSQLAASISYMGVQLEAKLRLQGDDCALLDIPSFDACKRFVKDIKGMMSCLKHKQEVLMQRMAFVNRYLWSSQPWRPSKEGAGNTRA